jgi:hypothetical protein
VPCEIAGPRAGLEGAARANYALPHMSFLRRPQESQAVTALWCALIKQPSAWLWHGMAAMGRRRRPGESDANPEDKWTGTLSGERPPTADRGQSRDEATRLGTTSGDVGEGSVSVEHTGDPLCARVHLNIVLPWEAALTILQLVRGAPDRRG